ncbi:unnamed protein product [Peniophora sp. CBMAI 1063]|nr:unnamed protein product [Peniophora sp. CBMAI 1063]
MGISAYPLVPVANSLAALLIILTLVSNGVHSGHNRCVVMFQGWVLTGVLLVFLQSVIWSHTDKNVAPVFCDISTRLQIGINAGIPACILLIMRRLWLVIGGDLELGGYKLAKDALIDYLFGIAFPVLQMVLYYVVQGTRFQIIEGYGCMSGVYFSGVSFLLLDVWPLLFAIGSISLYSWRVMLHLQRHKRIISRMLRGRAVSDSTHHVRAFVLASAGTLFSLPVALMTTYDVYLLATPTPVFWPGWKVIHTDWDPVLLSAQDWRGSPLSSTVIYWDQWVNAVLSVAIFILFGLNQSSRATYLKAYTKTRQILWSAMTWSRSKLLCILPPQPLPMTGARRRRSAELLAEEECCSDNILPEAWLDPGALDALESGTRGLLVTVDLQIELPPAAYTPNDAKSPVLIIRTPER